MAEHEDIEMQALTKCVDKIVDKVKEGKEQDDKGDLDIKIVAGRSQLQEQDNR